MKVKKIIIILLIPIIMVGCSEKDVEKNDNQTQESYNHVEVKNIEKEFFNKTINLVGETEAYKKITISSDLNEKIIKNNISVGDNVKKDDILYQFDKTNYQLNYDSAKNSYENSLIELKKINDIESNENLKYTPILNAKNNYMIAKSDFEKISKDYENAKKLYKEGAISTTSFDQIENQFNKAKESFVMAENNYLIAKNNYKYDKQKITINVNIAKNNMNTAKENLENTVVKAPINGVISYEDINIGQKVNRGQVLCKIINLDKIYIQSGVSEKEVNNIYKGQKVDVNIDALDKTFKGELVTIGPSPLPESKKYPIKILIDNLDNSIKEKMYSNISIILKRDEYLSIPKEAVVKDESKNYIYTVNDNKAIKKEISIITQNEEEFAVTGDIKVNDKLIIKWQDDLDDKSKVKIVK